VLVKHAPADDSAPGHVRHDGGGLHRSALTAAGQPAGGRDQGQQDGEHVRRRERYQPIPSISAGSRAPC